MSEQILPSMPKKVASVVDEQRGFGGLQADLGSDGHGVLYMSNWISEDGGGLRVRAAHRRYVSEDVTEGESHGLCVHDGELMLACGTGLYRVLGMDQVEKVGDLSDSPKQFASFGHRLFILPDRVWYDSESHTCHSIDVSVTVSDAVLTGVSVTRREGSWTADGFQKGDGIRLFYGVPPEKGGEYRIMDVDAECMTLDRAVPTQGVCNVVISRDFPDVKQMCVVGDRLMAIGDHSIFVCEKDRPFNWFAGEGLGSTAPVQMAVGGHGTLTGCTCWQGYALFFKEDRIYKLMGSGAGSYLLQDTPAPGVAEDASRTLCSVGGTLYYWSRSGLQRYGGSYPQNVGRGEVGYLASPTAVCDGAYYYLSGRDASDVPRMYAVCMLSGAHFPLQSERGFGLMETWNGHVYGLADDRSVWQLARVWASAWEDEKMETDAPVSASVTFADAACRLPQERRLCGVSLLIETPDAVKENASLTVSVQYDEEETWQVVGRFEGRIKHRLLDCPVLPRRCDFYRLRLEAVGEWRLKGIYRWYEF